LSTIVPEMEREWSVGGARFDVFLFHVCTFTVHDRFATISSTDEERARIRPCKHCILGQAPHLATPSVVLPGYVPLERSRLREDAGKPALMPSSCRHQLGSVRGMSICVYCESLSGVLSPKGVPPYSTVTRDFSRNIFAISLQQLSTFLTGTVLPNNRLQHHSDLTYA